MRLTDLEPKFNNDSHEGLILIFLCPKCRGHGLRVPVIVTHVQGPASGRWAITSLDLASLSCSPSIQHTDNGCQFHFTITGGQIIEN